MAYIQRNINPCLRSVGDCAVRALAVATNKSWEETYAELCMLGFQMCDMPNSNEVISAFMRKNGFQKRLIPNYLPDRYSIQDFTNDNPYGVYVLGTGSHVVAVVDGDYIDIWDSGDEIPIYFFTKGEFQ